jgi:uncharacterized protein YqjF (DUF2071 family)
MITRNVDCVIERRLLVSYRIDPDQVQALLPDVFRPQLVNGHAVGGVCFIRMGALRPAHFPRAAGVTTENAAHRFAVEWDDDQGSHTGVWIPRRDTNSRTTAAMGASIFPGAYHHARFQVTESADTIRIGVRSRDRAIQLSVSAAPATALDSQLFANLDEAADFFRRGALGFSPSTAHGCLDGVHLHSTNWTARPMSISAMNSSLFDDATTFPEGSRALDSALLMTNITARWTADAATARGITNTAAGTAVPIRDARLDKRACPTGCVSDVA